MSADSYASPATNGKVEWSTDAQLFDRAEQLLYTAVVGDVMDRRGRKHRFLPPHVRPLRDDMVVVGRAMPVMEADALARDGRRGNNASLDSSFGLMLDALDDLGANEVYICSGASPKYALWGENMSMRARHLEAAGAVVNGYSRDTRGILEMDFPTFSYGPYAQDQAPRGKVIDYRVPIEMEHVRIYPGDIVFGDIDGVCIVPQDIEDEVFEAAFERVQGESMVKEALREGMTASEAFERYGIL